MHLINIDMVGAQTPEASVNLLHEAGPGEIVAGLVVLIPEQAGLRGDDHLVAQAALFKNLAEHFLGMIPAIHRGNVEKVDSVGNRGMDDFARIVVVTAVPVAAKVPAADRQGRDLILDETDFLVNHDKHSFSFSQDGLRIT